MADSFATPWTVAYQAPLFMGFPRQEYWSRLSFRSPGDLPDPRIKPGPPALQVVKQEMERVNLDILGINELKWTGMGEFNSDDHYIYYCGQESLRRNGVAIMVNKRI